MHNIPRTTRRGIPVVLLAAGVLLFGTACSGSTSDAASTSPPSGSSSAGPESSQAPQAQSSGGARTGGGGTTGQQSGTQGDYTAEFAKCMRANGIPSFPDPKPGGGNLGPGSGVDLMSPKVQDTINGPCKSLAPKAWVQGGIPGAPTGNPPGQPQG
jgi:hypothetical protein